MAEAAPRSWTVAEFFAWQESQAERYEFVAGQPLAMTAGAGNVHDDIVVNCLAELRTQLRAGPCRPFTGDGSIETLPGQIRRPDIGIDCGRRDPNGLRASDPRLVIEVLSPGTRDFDTFEKLGEYRAVETLDHIVFIDPDAPQAVHWARTADRRWERRLVDGLDRSIDLPDIGVSLRLAEIYDGVSFAARPRLVGEARGTAPEA